LSLSSNHLCDNGIQVLAKALTFNNSTLDTLALHSTGITDKGVEYLAEMLKTNRTMMELRLSGNEIGNQGVQLLAKALTHHNNTFR
jgi:Ran GTPase-activating protein (RanGAP) involved in mRNA processing and transport